MVRAYTLSTAAVLCWIAATLTVGAPQEPRNSQLPKFQAQTDLVLVPVIAHRGGKHVEGLKSDDFTLLMGGKPQAIDLFEEVHPSPPVKTVQTGEFSNTAGDSGGAAQQFTIVAIDFENTAPLDQTYLKEEIVKFLSSVSQTNQSFNLLNLANVAVYPLDARHGSNTSFANYDVKYSDAPLSEAVAVNQADNKEIIDSFKAIAAATGGKPCFNRTDLANCLQEASDDSQNYYMLGFYLDKRTRPGWHPISVKLNGPRTDLTYRDGVLLDATSPEKSKLTDLQLAMVSPLNYTALPFHGKFDDPVDKGDKKVIKFALDVPPGAINPDEEDNHLGFDVVVAIRGKGGKEIKKLAQRIDRVLTAKQAAVIRTRGIHYTNLLELPPGDYGVWLVMRESSSGRTGSAVTTLNIK